MICMVIAQRQFFTVQTRIKSGPVISITPIVTPRSVFYQSIITLIRITFLDKISKSLIDAHWEL